MQQEMVQNTEITMKKPYQSPEINVLSHAQNTENFTGSGGDATTFS